MSYIARQTRGGATAGAHPQVLLHHGSHREVCQEAAASGDAEVLLRLLGERAHRQRMR